MADQLEHALLVSEITELTWDRACFGLQYGYVSG
jgi:hypothetical protein